MPSPAEIRTALRDLESFDGRTLPEGQRARIDNVLGLLYEAYVQARLDERGLGVDVSGVCGFIRYVNVIPLNVSRSSRAVGPTFPR